MPGRSISTRASPRRLCYKGPMMLHLLKLCVGCESIEDLADWQRRRLAALREAGAGAGLMHVTRQTPRREGFAPGCSIYWVIGGFIRARQKIMALHEIRGADGILRCGLGLDPKLAATEPHPRRAFQGWRYLAAADAPADLAQGLAGGGAAIPAEIPPAMRQALIELRLI